MEPVKVAAVQAAPVLLDRDATVAKVVALAEKAAAEGARLVAFPEAFVPVTRTGCCAPGPGTPPPLRTARLGHRRRIDARHHRVGGPIRQREETLIADLDLRSVAIQRRHIDPVGHYNRPDIFRLHVDISPHPAVHPGQQHRNDRTVTRRPR